MQKKYFLTVLALGMGLTANCSAAASPFADVPADHWAYDAVAQLAEDGILSRFIEREGIVFDRETLTIRIVKK